MQNQIPIRSSASTGLRDIHMFWYGPVLSRLERLCMMSFVANGHRVLLHVYDVPVGVPAQVTLCDAANILPASALFRHRRTGSVALFADWFRYRLLHQQGGVWSDTDVVCLRPFDFKHDEIFGWQSERTINNAVLGLPIGHEVAEWMANACEQPNRSLPYDSLRIRIRKWKRRVLQGDRRENVRWGENGPRGLTLALRHLGYANKALPISFFYSIGCEDWYTLFEPASPQYMKHFNAAYAVHLWNNKMRERPGFDKDALFSADSAFEIWCSRFLSNNV